MQLKRCYVKQGNWFKMHAYYHQLWKMGVQWWQKNGDTKWRTEPYYCYERRWSQSNTPSIKNYHGHYQSWMVWKQMILKTTCCRWQILLRAITAIVGIIMLFGKMCYVCRYGSNIYCGRAYIRIWYDWQNQSLSNWNWKYSWALITLWMDITTWENF